MSNPSKQFEMIRLYPKLDSDPAEGKVGEIYYNTTLQTLRLCIDSSPIWNSIGGISTDPFQDRNALLIGGGLWTNTPGLTSNTLDFTSSAYLQIPGLQNNSNQILSTSISLADGEVAYVDINRNNLPSSLTLQIATNDSITYNPDRLIIARNIAGIIIIDNRLSLIPGQTGELDSLQTNLELQDRNLKLIGGGIWSFNGSNLTITANTYVSVFGLPLASNLILPSSYSLPSGSVLYTTLNRTSSPQNLTVNSAAIPFIPGLNDFVIAENNSGVVYLANGETLIAGESKVLGEGLSLELMSALGASDFKDKTGQLRIINSIGPITLITPLNKVASDATIRSISLKNVNAIFDGVQINWQTGEILDYPTGTIPLSIFPAPNTIISPLGSRWYSISLVPGIVDLNNEIPLNIVITPAASDSLSLKAEYTSGAIQVGQVLVTNNVGSISISQANIIQNIAGAGSTFAGGANNTIQFNNLGGLDGDSQLTWDSFEKTIGLNGLKYGVLSSGLTVLDNQSSWTPIITLNKTTYPFVIIEYSLVKSGVYRVGRFLLTNDGTNTGFSDDYTETAFSGVNFDAIISGSNVQIVYTTTSTGAAGTLKHSTKKWS